MEAELRGGDRTFLTKRLEFYGKKGSKEQRVERV